MSEKRSHTDKWPLKEIVQSLFWSNTLSREIRLLLSTTRFVGVGYTEWFKSYWTKIDDNVFQLHWTELRSRALLLQEHAAAFTCMSLRGGHFSRCRCLGAAGIHPLHPAPACHLQGKLSLQPYGAPYPVPSVVRRRGRVWAWAQYSDPAAPAAGTCCGRQACWSRRCACLGSRAGGFGADGAGEAMKTWRWTATSSCRTAEACSRSRVWTAAVVGSSSRRGRSGRGRCRGRPTHCASSSRRDFPPGWRRCYDDCCWNNVIIFVWA